MSEELHKLQRIGAQKIHEKTHIPIQHIQEILQSDFSSFSRVQFLGFISILEREYNENLSAHKAFGMSYFDELEKQTSSSLTISPAEKKSKKSLYLTIVVILFIVIFVLQYTVFTQKVQETEVDDTLIENVEKSIQPKKEDNQTQELNSTKEVLVKVQTPEVKITKSFKITSKSKVWFGYIDVLTNKKRQKTFQGEFELDPNKEWLLRFGHGFINMYINGEVVKFNSRDITRFLYKDGELQAINSAEFKKLNRGSSW